MFLHAVKICLLKLEDNMKKKTPLCDKNNGLVSTFIFPCRCPFLFCLVLKAMFPRSTCSKYSGYKVDLAHEMYLCMF